MTKARPSRVLMEPRGLDRVAGRSHIQAPLTVLRLAMFRFLRLALGLMFLSAAASALADARICTSQDVLDFGSRQVGSIASASVTVTNCGDQTWSFDDVSVHPSTGPAFHVNTSCATGLSL